MLSKEKNELLTQVGPGTPAGELLRRYWHPVCPASEVTPENPKKRIRLLGEDLVLYQDEQGDYSCITERCAHRGCSLHYGWIEDGGIRCPYHGWKYDKEGRVVEQPFESGKNAFLNKKLMNAYKVSEFAGLLFVYMGPDPAPLIPRWAPLVREDGHRRLEVQPVLNCNWLQIQENTVDSIHTYYLHGVQLQKHGKPWGNFFVRPVLSYDWKECEWGIEKTVDYGGERPEREIRPPMIFPNILIIDTPDPMVQWRVPVDDTHTLLISYLFTPSKDGSKVEQTGDLPVDYVSLEKTFKPNGEYDVVPSFSENPMVNMLYAFFNQDRMAWETEGEIYDRTQEHLGNTDRGIAMFRKMLERQIEIVQNGGEPMVVLRDPAKNQRIDFESTAPTVDL